MRTLLIAIAAAGALAIATPALADHSQHAAAPVVYYSPYNGNGYYVPWNAVYSTFNAFNRGWYGQPAHYGHPQFHRGQCDNPGLHRRLYGNAGLHRGWYGNPGLHRGHYKNHKVFRRQAARRNWPNFWNHSSPWQRDGHRGHHDHPYYAKQDRKFDDKHWNHRNRHDNKKNDRNHHHKRDGDRNHHRHGG